MSRMNSVYDCRQPPINTGPASRHTYQMGCALLRGDPYPLLQENPQQCGESMMSTVGELCRAKLKVKAALELLDGWEASDLSRAVGIRRSRCQELLDVLRSD